MSSEVTEDQAAPQQVPYETPAESVPYGAQPQGAETAEGAGVHLPPQSIWPVTSALGVATIGFGLVTLQLFCLIGVLVAAYGAFMWVQELRHESH